MSSGTAIQCCICNDEIIPGENFKTRDTDGATVHTSCFNSLPTGAEIPLLPDSNQNTEHKSSPEPELTPDPSRDALKRVVIEVLSECFANVDFAFLDQMIDEKIEAKLLK